MKLFVQARKDGYNVLYPKPTPTEFFQFAGDIRPDSKDPNLLGKYIYTISFASGGCIFTKHVIIQDVQRQGLGNVGFSIFIPNVKKLSGDDVLKLLDELSNTYCKNYCSDYYLENKQEDWTIFEAIKNQYKLYNLSNDDTENYQRGTADAAYIYYADKIELSKFFDNPYQEEYSTYKQVFLVEKNLEDKSDNPLNAIPHDPNANLTGKIDLENPKYKLIYNQQARGGIKIEVKVNGSLRYSKSKIKRKEDLQIIWSKQFCESKVKSGKWYEIGSEFLEINDIEKTITVKEIDIHPTTYTLSIHTKDRFSNPITDAAITLKIGNYSPGRNAINNTIQITEEDLQNKCYIIAQKDNLISSQREIKLEDTKGSISLILSEHKKVNFYVKDENGLVNNYNIQISNKEVQPKEGNVVFIGEEIEKTWQISVSHRDYETERFNYCPAKDGYFKDVELRRKQFSGGGNQTNRKKGYYLKIDEKKGKRSVNGKIIQDHVDGAPGKDCDSKFGYRFERWEPKLKQQMNGFEGHYEAIFKELWYHKIPKLAWIFIAIALIAIMSYFLFANNESKSNTDIMNKVNEINAYVNGVELKDSILKQYDLICDSLQKSLNSNVGKETFWEKISPFGTNDNEKLSQEKNALLTCCLELDTAIIIRNSINLGKIDILRGINYSPQQKKFEDAIKGIGEKYKKQIGDMLNAEKVSQMNLNQVADSITKTQNEIILKEKATQEKPEDEKPVQVQEKAQTHENQKKPEKPISDAQQITLEEEFWDLVHSGNAQMEAYSNLLKKHKSKGGDIIAYLNKICKNSASFKKFKDIPEMDRKSAKTLTEIDIN